MLILQTKNLSAKVTLNNLPTIKQAFVVASVIIFAAVILAKLVNPDFIYLALLPAIGLMVSGLSGFCPLVFLLQLIPNNKSE